MLNVRFLELVSLIRNLTLLFAAFGVLNTSAQGEVSAQEKKSGFYVGGDFGVLIASKKTANYYNGFGPLNSITRIIYQKDIYRTLKEEVFGDFDFYMGQYPTEMRYKPAMNLGATLGYRINKDFSLFGSFTFANLKLADKFTIILDDPGNQISDDVIRLADISGTEKRLNLFLGVTSEFGDNEKSKFLMEYGFTANWVDMLTNEIRIEEYEYSIKFQSNPPLKQGGWGLGGFFGLGGKFSFDGKTSVQLGARFVYSGIALEMAGKDPVYGLQQLYFVRFTYGS